MRKLYLDSETCGLHSMPVLLQFAHDDEPVVLYDLWLKPVRDTLTLVESFCENTVVGFNLAFDWFQLCKLYTIWRLLPPDWIPIERVNEIAGTEDAAKDGPCLKPAGALDLLLHSRKGPYQSLMARNDIKIRRVPTILAYALRDELEQRVKLDDIYFARSHDKDAPRWKVFDILRDGKVWDQCKDVVLKFNPAGGLKYLAEHALGKVPKYHYADVEPPAEWRPIEFGFAPTASAVSSAQENWEVRRHNPKKGIDELKGYAWPGVVAKFVDHWANREDAREYAHDDIIYTRELDDHFGNPEPSDDDSVLACMVAAIRWHGFAIDREGIKKLYRKAQEKIDDSPINTNRPPEVREYLRKWLDDLEAVELDKSTNKKVLKAISGLRIEQDEPCTVCDEQGCHRCDNGILRKGPHPVVKYAKEIIGIKSAKKEVETYKKLLLAGRFHADFNVVGTRSSRMSGSGGLNAQGIKATDDVRSCFPLAWEDMTLCGGDFDSFEVTLAEAVYRDEQLRSTLTTWMDCHKCFGKRHRRKCEACEGGGCPACEKRGYLATDDANDPKCDECEGVGQITKKIHAAFAQELYPGVSYESIMASKEMYGTGKAAIFAMVYGGDWNTLVRNAGVAPQIAKAAYEGFLKRYPGVSRARDITFQKFCSMRQPGGIGTQVFWHEPADFVESFLGFRRYFTLENAICKTLFELANRPPPAWKAVKIPVIRSYQGRVQSAHGAVSSALYGAAFGIQSANTRAAANHEIQSPGGQITKHVQRRIWDLQPIGVSDWKVAPMNVHDEIMCSTARDYVSKVREVVRETVESFRPQVPLIGMTWFEGMPNWAGKKSAGDPVKIRCREMLEPVA